MDQTHRGDLRREVLPDELRAIVRQDPREGDAELAQRLAQVVQEPGGELGGLLADDQPHDRGAGGDVDRDQLPDRPDALQPPDVERVQRQDLPRCGGEQAEPERALQGRVGDQAGVCGGQRRQRRDPLPRGAQMVPAQHLGHARALTTRGYQHADLTMSRTALARLAEHLT